MNPLIDEIEPFIVMEILERAKALEAEGKNIVHLEVGEPDFEIPKPIIETSNSALKKGFTHYTHSLGDLDLRNAIKTHYLKNYSVEISTDQIVITSGSSPAILLILLSLIQQNDEVLITDPGYACYRNFIKIANGIPVKIPVGAENGFQITKNLVETRLTEKTKALIINSPMNPSGNLISEKNLKSIAEIEPYIISDEIYHGLTYEEKAHSILEYTNHAFVISGFSKTYAMTGLRLGYLIAPKEFIRSIQKLQQNLFICASSVAQRCGITALQNCSTEVENMRSTYNKCRIFMLERLEEMGFEIPVKPTGAFYLFFDVSKFTDNVYNLAFDILEKVGVGVTPGTDFGNNGEGYLRLSYANSIENIEEGLNRLEKYFSKISH